MATDRYQRSSFFRPGEIPRLLAMLGMLAVMGMLIFQARNPSMWRWLERDGDNKDAAEEIPSRKKAAPVALAQADIKQPPAEAAPPVPDSPAAEKPAAGNPVGVPGNLAGVRDNSAGVPDPPKEPEIVAGTDLDPEEVAEFQKDIAPVTDGILEIPGVEAKPYARLFRWVENQPLAALKARAKRALPFREYAQKTTAEDHRGELAWLDLNIRQITPVDVSDNPLMTASGIERVYEVWGSTEQSQAFFYCCVTAHLPPGLKPGIVHQRGRFYGYYFKVLGYLPGGAKPNARPTPAPLFVGRLDWQPPKVAAVNPESDWNEVVIGAAVVALALCGWVLYRVLNRNRAAHLSGSLPTPEASAAGFSQFLERGTDSDHTGDNHAPYDDHANGHSHGTGLPYSDQSEA